MSTPPDQPSASPYSNPPSNQGGYGTPVPPRHNPYAQGPQDAGPYGPPPPGAAPGYYPGPYGPPPGAPAAGTRRGGAGRAVLWAVVGAAVASALWGGGVLLLGKDSAKADLRGYTVQNDLCAASDLSAFSPEYPQGDSKPGKYTTRGDALDDMSCSEGLERTGSSYADAYVYVEVQLHKKTDPQPEFADTWLGYKQHSDAKYQVTPVTGFGDEAYLVTEDTVSGGSGDRYVTLAVREGWMTYSMNWNEYASALSSGGGTSVPSVSQAAQWVKTATTSTLAKLKG